VKAFGLFLKDTRTITITAEDFNSGIASGCYKLSSTVLSEDELMAISDWSEYTGNNAAFFQDIVFGSNPMANIRPPAIPAVHFHGLSCCLYRASCWVCLE